MGKGEQTKEVIVQRAASLFNQQGYFGASLSDIMRATGLEKGGIYNHFVSKEELALQAFEYSSGLVSRRFGEAIRARTNSVDRLLAIIEAFQSMFEAPPLPGGCPIFNTLVEADDAHPVFKAKACAVVDSFFETVQRIVNKGLERGEIRAGTEPEAVAAILYSSLQGAWVLSRAYNNPAHLNRVAQHLVEYLENSVRI